jgi:hypothetical protein
MIIVPISSPAPRNTAPEPDIISSASCPAWQIFASRGAAAGDFQN